MREIVLASSNKGKIREFSEIFNRINISIVPQTKFNVPDADETGLSFIENAIIKARHCSKYTNLPAMADDSGLCVEVLNGNPGIYSARYSGIHGDDKANIQKLLSELKQDNNRKAEFICAIAYVKNYLDPTPLISVGKLEGIIAFDEQGENGFGYDPIFQIPEENKTLAQISQEFKNKISHRAKALEKMIKQL
ncbi:RdgB/HAM1 family non-canonical purine NTP pyrophosphatase [Francisella frigiditurris]|uniref:dITP/XTP pyrophosphatase n=1 Tax=Francisella frigiditurris TaxID=1542390 RepID=A0A1J0KRW7_9GAMM|nr:RdgB/HAM1 family non-canonical purine NTP pyrophosphatase [Francisella frigiditurris]APC96509.1 non-canonical purine NTP pyrophosphatase, RdgB/HAM1 family [Francisella frigiditurris]